MAEWEQSLMGDSSDASGDPGCPTPAIGDTHEQMQSGARGGTRQSNLVDGERASRSAPTALWGWSPPDLPAGDLARTVDRVVPRSGIGFVLYWAVVFTLEYGVAPHLPVRGRLVVEAVAALAAGVWCGVNFWRCRHAHCLVSGPGWLLLSALGIGGAIVGHSVLGGFDQVAFFAVLVVAVVFEAAWRWAQGTNAVRRPPTPRQADRTGFR
jgi:hypothetical protein